MRVGNISWNFFSEESVGLQPEPLEESNFSPAEIKLHLSVVGVFFGKVIAYKKKQFWCSIDAGLSA